MVNALLNYGMTAHLQVGGRHRGVQTASPIASQRLDGRGQAGFELGKRSPGALGFEMNE